MRTAFHAATRRLLGEIVVLGVIYFGLAFLGIVPFGINWMWLLCVLLLIFAVQFTYFYSQKYSV